MIIRDGKVAFLPSVVILCGSTRFKEEFEHWNKFFTLEGFIVLSVGVFPHSGDEITDQQKERLDDLHKSKIDVAGMVFIINKDNYIGDSTLGELDYAKKLKKDIYFAYEYDELGRFKKFPDYIKRGVTQ